MDSKRFIPLRSRSSHLQPNNTMGFFEGSHHNHIHDNQMNSVHEARDIVSRPCGSVSTTKHTSVNSAPCGNTYNTGEEGGTFNHDIGGQTNQSSGVQRTQGGETLFPQSLLKLSRPDHTGDGKRSHKIADTRSSARHSTYPSVMSPATSTEESRLLVPSEVDKCMNRYHLQESETDENLNEASVIAFSINILQRQAYLLLSLMMILARWIVASLRGKAPGQ